MFRIRMSLAALLIALLACRSAEAGDKAKGKKKKGKAVAGEVVEVKAESGKEEGTLIIKTRVKKGDTTAKPEEKTFKVGSGVKITKAAKKNSGTQPETLKFSQIQKGARVRIKSDGDKVEEIQVQATKKKSNKTDGAAPKKKNKKDTAAVELF